MKTRVALTVAAALSVSSAAHAISTLSGARLEQTCGPPGAHEILAVESSNDGPVVVDALADCGTGFHAELLAFGRTPTTDPTVAVPTLGFLVDPATLRVVMPPDQANEATLRSFTQQSWASFATTTNIAPAPGELIPLEIEIHLSVDLTIQKLGGEGTASTAFLAQLMSSELSVMESIQGQMDDLGGSSLVITSDDPTTLEVLFDPATSSFVVQYTTVDVLAATAPFGTTVDILSSFAGAISVASFGVTAGSTTFVGNLAAVGDQSFSYSIHSLDPRVMFVAVPEPSTGLLITAGIAGLMLGLRRRV